MNEEIFKTLVMTETVQDRSFDFHPTSFDEFIGQKKLKQKLELYSKAASMRGEAIDHILLFGPPGLGKTTLSKVISNQMDSDIRICSGPMMERSGDLVAILSSLSDRDVLFIDEIHRMPRAVEEVLYSAMEHFRVDVIIGEGAGARSVNLPINPFTLIGATTKAGMISAPLRSRFGIHEKLDFYAESDLKDIILQNAKFLSISVPSMVALKIAKSSRGTPRVAKRLLRRVRDFAEVENGGIVTENLVDRALHLIGIDQKGLTEVDRRIIDIIIKKFDCGPVGLETIASMVGEDSQTIEEVYEPFLLREGFIEKTSRGRKVPSKIARSFSQQR